MSTSDFVVIATAYTESMKHLFNKEAFATMKNTAILVNISRGNYCIIIHIKAPINWSKLVKETAGGGNSFGGLCTYYKCC